MVWGIILAAGSAQRLREAGLACAKQFLRFEGKPLYWHGAYAMAKVPELGGLVFVFPPHLNDAALADLEAEVKELFFEANITLQWKVVRGGDTRQLSVLAGLGGLPSACQRVLVHDSARPFASPMLMSRVAEALDKHEAVIPAIAVSDTIKQVDSSSYVIQTHERKTLRAVQTPQGFDVGLLRKAHGLALEKGFEVTDDAMLVEHMGISVYVVDGEVANTKITTPEDLSLLEGASAMVERTGKPKTFCVTGFGYDVHRYGGERPFILGGVPIQTDITVHAHSDGDVLLHALCDAILGCLGGKTGDIGTLFPDNKPEYDNYPSGAILSDVLQMALGAGMTIVHVDLTIIAQVPKIAPHRYTIAKNIASMLQLPIERVSVKATTEEKLGFTGEKKGIKAVAVVSATKSLE